jgi:hypothetical protein
MFVPIDLSRYTKKWLNRYLVARPLRGHLQLCAFYGDNSFISINLANFVTQRFAYNAKFLDKFSHI